MKWNGPPVGQEHPGQNDRRNVRAGTDNTVCPEEPQGERWMRGATTPKIGARRCLPASGLHPDGKVDSLDHLRLGSILGHPRRSGNIPHPTYAAERNETDRQPSNYEMRSRLEGRREDYRRDVGRL